MLGLGVFWFLISMIHWGFALSWCSENKRSNFESLPIVVFMLVAWPLFTLRMLFRGYKDFLVKNWPENFWN